MRKSIDELFTSLTVRQTIVCSLTDRLTGLPTPHIHLSYISIYTNEQRNERDEQGARSESTRRDRYLLQKLVSYNKPQRQSTISIECLFGLRVRVEWVVADLAGILSGFIVIPLHHKLDFDAVQSVVHNADVKCVGKHQIEDSRVVGLIWIVMASVLERRDCDDAESAEEPEVRRSDPTTGHPSNGNAYTHSVTYEGNE